MDSMNEPPEMIVYRNLEKFIKYREIKTDYKFLTPERFSSALNTYQYILIEGRIDNKNESILTLIFLIQDGSKYQTKADEFKKIINRVVNNNRSEDKKKNNVVFKIDILYITSTQSTSYINKKIIEFQQNDPHTNIFPYTYEDFILVLPECLCSSIHTVATTEEVDKYCARLFIDINMLPKIYISDPQLIWINVKKGDVVKIISKSETAMEVEELRLVI